jgi:dihydroflavonol-4-reductase
VSGQLFKNVLVTGGAGFVGSRIVRSYLESGVNVRILDNLARGSLQSLDLSQSGLEFLQGDLCDPGGHSSAFAGQDLVIHAAAMLTANSPAERNLQKRINVDATANIIEACERNRVSTLVYISTVAVIGISSDPNRPADETFSFTLGHVGSGYKDTKHQAEQMVLKANGSNLKTMVVNLGIVFGRRQQGYQQASVIERVLGSRVVICSNGGLSLVHVDDVVEGIRRVAANGRAGERYILSGDNLTFQEIADTVCRVAGVSKRIICIPDPIRNFAGRILNPVDRARGNDMRLHLDHRYAYQFFSSEKAQTEVGYRPRSFSRIVTDYFDCVGRARATS